MFGSIAKQPEPPICIEGSPVLGFNVCPARQVPGSERKKPRNKRGFFFQPLANESASDFLADGVASRLARAAPLADRCAFPDDHLVTLAGLRLSRTNGATDTGADRGPDRPTDGEPYH